MLASRADASKQAMNHLLGQLESQGYIMRQPDPADRRTRIVHLTERGQAALAVVEAVAEEVEGEWLEIVGKEAYVEIQAGLAALNDHFERTSTLGNAAQGTTDAE